MRSWVSSAHETSRSACSFSSGSVEVIPVSWMRCDTSSMSSTTSSSFSARAWMSSRSKGVTNVVFEPADDGADELVAAALARRHLLVRGDDGGVGQHVA